MNLFTPLFVIVSIVVSPTLLAAELSDVIPWEEVKIDVANYRDRHFSKSIRAFYYENKSPPTYIVYQKVEGSADERARLNSYDVIHIEKHLKTDATLTDQAELVVGGDVVEGVVIETTGINSLYVGGDFRGTIRSLGSLTLVVKGDFEGKLITGHPISTLVIEGNYKGTVTHESDQGALVYIDTQGYMAKDSIDALYSQNFTLLDIRAGNSELKRGIHYRKRGTLVIGH